MEKRLDKLPQRKEKIQLSCSWGFTNLLDFKNGGRRNQKLLTNGRPKQKNVSDVGDQRNNLSFDMQVQNLLRQETINENSVKKCTHSDMKQKKSSSYSLFKQLQNNDKKKTINYSKKTHQKSLSSSSDNRIIMDEMLEEVCHQIYQENNDQLDNVKKQLLQTKAKAFIDQIYINRKNCGDNESKEFLEAEEILKLNMDVFLKLLQKDKERSKLCLEHKSSECETGNAGDYQDHESTMSAKKKESNKSLSSRRIVILKPESKVKQSAENVSCHCSSLKSHYILKNKGQVKGASFLALEDIKNKFTQSFGTNQKSLRDKHCQEEGKKARGKSTLCLDVDLTLSNETQVDDFTEQTFDKNIDTSEQQKLDLFLEAKRHLYKRLKDVDLGESLPNKDTPRTLKMILSSRDPGTTMPSILQNEAVKIVSFSQSPNQTKEISSCSDEQKQSFPDDTRPSDKTTKRVDSSPLDIYKLQIIENIEEKEEYRSPVSVLEPFCFEEDDSPPSMIPGSAESKLQPRCLIFEDISFVPSSKDHQLEPRTSINEEEEEDCLSLYIRAVIHVSGLSFNEFSSENTLLPDVLHSYIDNEVRPIASYVHCDIKLLLDCVNEVIVGVYRSHFGCSQKTRRVPQKETFIDEVLKEVKLYVHPKNGQPTLDQLVRKDIASSSSWLDLQNDTGDILNLLAEDVLHESILDTILNAKI